jgi:hypothetical protein
MAKHVRGVVDLSSPGPGGAIVIAARGHFQTLTAHGTIRSFAPSYAAPPGLEPYIVRSSGQRVRGAGCRFTPGAIYALRLRNGHGVTVVDGSGQARRFAALPSSGLENGIAFDHTGHFGHRLLVTRLVGGRTTVYGIDCRGRVRVVTRTAPRAEGGVAVAPPGFGRYGGDLIVPDELSGNLYAVSSTGRSVLMASSGVPHGQDIGVESEGFVPPRFGQALVADRGTPQNRHPGDDAILGLSRTALRSAGVRSGDLLVVTEGGALTVAVSCAQSCQVHSVAHGPARAHIEGHVVFTAPR